MSTDGDAPSLKVHTVRLLFCKPLGKPNGPFSNGRAITARHYTRLIAYSEHSWTVGIPSPFGEDSNLMKRHVSKQWRQPMLLDGFFFLKKKVANAAIYGESSANGEANHMSKPRKTKIYCDVPLRIPANVILTVLTVQQRRLFDHAGVTYMVERSFPQADAKDKVSFVFSVTRLQSPSEWVPPTSYHR